MSSVSIECSIRCSGPRRDLSFRGDPASACLHTCHCHRTSDTSSCEHVSCPPETDSKAVVQGKSCNSRRRSHTSLWTDSTRQRTEDLCSLGHGLTLLYAHFHQPSITQEMTRCKVTLADHTKMHCLYVTKVPLIASIDAIRRRRCTHIESVTDIYIYIPVYIHIYIYIHIHI